MHTVHTAHTKHTLYTLYIIHTRCTRYTLRRSLTELNLRRNRIEECLDLDHLPALQRLFLSNNALATLDAIGSVIRAPGLTEYDEERYDERA